jgi:hypothetical protein
VLGKNAAIDESTIGFKCKITFKTYNKKKKPMKCGTRLFVLADSDTGYAHSIIPNYRKRTSDMCNLLHSEKPFKNNSFLDGLSVSGIDDYHLFTDRYYSNVELVQELDDRNCKYTFCLLTLCPYCTNFLGKIFHLVAWQAFKNPSY